MQRTVEIRIHDASAHFQVKALHCDSPYFTATEEPADDEKVHRILVRTNPPLPEGWLQTQVRLVTDNKNFPSLTIPIHCHMAGALAVSPTAIFVDGRADFSMPIVRFVNIAPGKVRQFKILGIQTPSSGMKATVIDKCPEGFLVRLSTSAPGKDLDGKCLRIVTDAKGAEEVLIPIHLRQSAKPIY